MEICYAVDIKVPTELSKAHSVAIEKNQKKVVAEPTVKDTTVFAAEDCLELIKPTFQTMPSV